MTRFSFHENRFKNGETLTDPLRGVGLVRMINCKYRSWRTIMPIVNAQKKICSTRYTSSMHYDFVTTRLITGVL
jgi:hypothetical protein